MSSLKVTAVKAVSHAVSSAYAAMIKRAALIPAASSVVVPAVSATVSDVHARAAKIEVITARIACIDGKMPYSGSPI